MDAGTFFFGCGVGGCVWAVILQLVARRKKARDAEQKRQ